MADSRHPLDGSLPAEECADIRQAIAMELHPPPLPLPVLPPTLLLLRPVSFIGLCFDMLSWLLVPASTVSTQRSCFYLCWRMSTDTAAATTQSVINCDKPPSL